jgi:hypothetical protein
MDEPRPFYRDPKIQAILVVLVTALLYFFTLGRQGAVREVLLAGGYSFVSVSNDGGVRVLSLQNPAIPVEVGYYDTPGSARKMALQGSLLYVADGERGLRIVNVLDPGSPYEIGAIEILGETLDVAVAGRYAYLAMGGNGITVIDIADPAAPFFIHAMDTPGNAQALAVREINLLGTGNNAATQITATFVYVADGDRGLEIYNFLDPRQPAPMSSLDTSGNARDVALAGPFAFVADGRDGIQILDVTNPVLPAILARYDDGNFATAVDIAGNRLVFTEGDRGFTVLDLSNPLAPVRVLEMDTSGDAQAATMLGSLVYVADGSQGLRVIDLQAPGGPRQVGLFEAPGEATFGQLIRAALAIFRGQAATIPTKVWRTSLLIGFDLLLFFVTLFLWLAFFAQFLLPVRGLSERRKAINRLLIYLTGAHGPAITVENGIVKQRVEEARRRGPGVALFDTASAGVFRNPHMFTKVAGPGVIFTDPPEYLAGTVDLHVQAAGIGPREGDDPYAPQHEDETEDDYSERQGRRFETSGLTRDGVEIVPNISVVFRLASDPGQGRTQFGFDPESVRRAIAGEGINPDAPEVSEKRVSWTWLPARIAADLWREYLRKYPLDELFTLSGSPDVSLSPEERKTAFDRIAQMIRARMVSPEVEELDEYGRPTGKIKPSLEYAILEERGIKVLAAGVRNLRFPRVVENKLVEKWQATWLQRAQREARDIDRLLAQVKTLGQDVALKEFAIASGQQLGRKLLQQSPSPAPSLGWRETLESLVEGTLRLSVHEADLQPRLTNQRNILVEIIEWVRRQAG